MSRSKGKCCYVYRTKTRLEKETVQQKHHGKLNGKNIGQRKYDLSSVKGCEIQIVVFHWEIDVCQSSNMFKYVMLVEYPSYVHNIPPALVLKGVAQVNITMGIFLLGCHVVYMLSEIGCVGTDRGTVGCLEWKTLKQSFDVHGFVKFYVWHSKVTKVWQHATTTQRESKRQQSYSTSVLASAFPHYLNCSKERSRSINTGHEENNLQDWKSLRLAGWDQGRH